MAGRRRRRQVGDGLMTWSVCDGSYIDESMAAAYDRIAEQYRTYPHHYRHSYESRQRDHRAKRSVRRYETSETETRVVAAIVTLADRMGDEERAVFAQADSRNGDEPDDDEAARIVREHGFTPDRLVALRGSPAPGTSSLRPCCAPPFAGSCATSSSCRRWRRSHRRPPRPAAGRLSPPAGRGPTGDVALKASRRRSSPFSGTQRRQRRRLRDATHLEDAVAFARDAELAAAMAE